jgi:hypothetical protein
MEAVSGWSLKNRSFVNSKGTELGVKLNIQPILKYYTGIKPPPFVSLYKDVDGDLMLKKINHCQGMILIKTMDGFNSSIKPHTSQTNPTNSK